MIAQCSYFILSIASLYFPCPVPAKVPIPQGTSGSRKSSVSSGLPRLYSTPHVEDLHSQHHLFPVLGVLISGIFFSPTIPVVQLVNSLLWLERYPEGLSVCRPQLPLLFRRHFLPLYDIIHHRTAPSPTLPPRWNQPGLMCTHL